MSVARGFGLNGKSYYANVAGPRSVSVQFTVNAADSGGLGITSLKSNGYVEHVFMHTSQTPGSVNGITNPNPQSGYAVIAFKNNFNVWLNSYSVQSVPLTSTSTTSLTAGHVYTITSVGNTTLANWQAVGLPQGFTPTVGQTFVATATVSITGTGTVGVPGVPVAPVVTVVGTPNTLLNNSAIASNAGAQMVLQFSSFAATGTISTPTLTMNSYTPAGTNNSSTPPVFTGTPAVLTGTISTPTFTSTSVYAATAPTDGTVVSLQFEFDGSSVTVDGL